MCLLARPLRTLAFDLRRLGTAIVNLVLFRQAVKAPARRGRRPKKQPAAQRRPRRIPQSRRLFQALGATSPAPTSYRKRLGFQENIGGVAASRELRPSVAFRSAKVALACWDLSNSRAPTGFRVSERPLTTSRSLRPSHHPKHRRLFPPRRPHILETRRHPSRRAALFESPQHPDCHPRRPPRHLP